MEDANLKSFIAADWSEANTIGVVTEEQLRECAKQRCVRQENGENLEVVGEAVKMVVKRMHILKAQDPVWTLH